MRKVVVCGVAVAAIAAAPVAQAKPKPDKPKPSPYQCVPKNVGFNAKGKLVSSDLTQTAGADTARRSDDRFSGDLVVNVTRANHGAPTGEQTYTLNNTRVRLHPHSATAPAAGDRVKLTAKRTRLRKGCDTTGFESTVTVKKVDIKAAKKA
jgi:hypothetical protein